MNFTLIKSSGGTTYVLNSRLSIFIMNNSNLFSIYYKIENKFVATSYYIKENFLEDKISYNDEDDRYIADFLKTNPEITNQIKKIVKYSFI